MVVVAGHKVWLGLALFSLVGVGLCRALAEPQVVYNSLDGTWSWETPDGSSVWIQYPVNHQGLVPWNPAGFSYSISSDPASNRGSFDERIHSNFLDISNARNPPASNRGAFDDMIHSNFLDVSNARNPQHTFRSGRDFDFQIPNNNFESSIFPFNNQNNGQNNINVEEVLQNPTVSLFNDFQAQVRDEFPVTQINNFPVPELKTFPNTERVQFPSPVMDTFPDPVMNKFPVSINVPTQSPVEFNTVQFIADASPKILPTESEFEHNINNNFNDFSSVNFDTVALPAELPNESDFANTVSNTFGDLNSVERNELVKHPSVPEPVVRLTSRGRPQRQRLTTRKPLTIRKIVNRPKPRLLQPTPNSNRERRVRLTSRGRSQLFR